jgi:branched-chain amino acid transport system permease protein
VRVVNFAHGEFLMLGMYGTFLGSTHFGVHPYWMAVGLVPAFFVAGAAIQAFILQPLLHSEYEHAQIFATVGLSIALTNLALLLFSANVFSTPSYGVRNSIAIGPIQVLDGELTIFICGVLLAFGLHSFLQRTHLGRAIRAVSQNRAAAALMGININRIYAITFGIGTACVGLAAALVAPMYPVTPTVGTYFVLSAFVVVVLGGMGSLKGAFLGALIIGVVQSMSGYYLGAGLREISTFFIFIAILIFRPTGLFGLGRGSE